MSVSALATCINVLIAALVNDEIYNVSFVLSETTPIRRNLHIVFQKKQWIDPWCHLVFLWILFSEYAVNWLKIDIEKCDFLAHLYKIDTSLGTESMEWTSSAFILQN